MKLVADIAKKQLSSIDKDDIAMVCRALEGYSLDGGSQVVTEYERKLASYFNVNAAVATNSGTSALYMILLLLGIHEGDEVMLPCTAHISAAMPVIALGATPVFVDTKQDSFGLSIGSMMDKLSDQTKAIISMPVWGYPVDQSAIYALASNHEIPVIEDASFSQGSELVGSYVGSKADFGFASTHESTLINTGEGGYILTNDLEAANRLREIRDFGKYVSREGVDPDQVGKYGYQIGLNFKTTALNAALGISQLNKLKAKIAARTELAKQLRADLKTAAPYIEEIDVSHLAKPNYIAMLVKLDAPYELIEAKRLALREHGYEATSPCLDGRPLYELPLFNTSERPCHNSVGLLNSTIAIRLDETMNRTNLEEITSLISGQ